MTSYSPTVAAFLQKLDAPIPPPPGPKLAYEVGERCWIFIGIQDANGNPKFIPGHVVYWFDLPALAQRLYVILLDDRDFIHVETRDATLMAASPEIGMPFMKTRHDNRPRASDRKQDWRNS